MATKSLKSAGREPTSDNPYAFLVFLVALFLTGLVDLPGRRLRDAGVSLDDLVILRPIAACLLFSFGALAQVIRHGLPRIDRAAMKAVASFAFLGVVCTNIGTTYSVSIMPSSIAVATIFSTSIVTTFLVSRFHGTVSWAEITVALALILLTTVLLTDGVVKGDDWGHAAIVIPILTGIAQGLLMRVLGQSSLEPWSFYALSFGLGTCISILVLFAAGISIPGIVVILEAPASVQFDLMVLAGGITVLPYIAARYAAPHMSTFARGAASVSEPVGGVACDALNGMHVRPAQIYLIVLLIGVVLTHQIWRRYRGSIPGA